MRNSIARFTMQSHEFLIPICMIALGCALFLLLPLAFRHKSRSFSGIGLIFISYLFGITTWLLCLSFTLTTSIGWFWLFMGIVSIFGVFPIAIVGTYLIGNPSLSIYIIGLVVITAMTFISGVFTLSKVKD